MAQKKKHRSRSIMGRSDIPYAQRLKMQQQSNIAMNRERSAKILLYCISVALHELDGIGYKRLVRFSLQYKALEDEFYQDEDVGMARAKQRLAEIGIPISGEFYTAPDEGQGRRAWEVDTHMMQAAQVAQIVAVVAMNEEFGFGLERQTRVREQAAVYAKRYRTEGVGFLLEKLEKIGFAIEDGVAKVYLDEDGNAVRVKKAEAMIAKE